ncbi:hypothetical protein OSH08_05440 [Kaistia geumhonensis]|uniref:Uncharacterized protein n=1 Tax=Kaistia geumhonensis TaxID=410839 RepID=A0ABU0M5Y7_9HYPH|nr:hypothetical protein [Kaistia geumhonensis]MCX5478436.1 hypothetical protein [Kaistia geumhonensis]MDQ0516346.1 hypothetical protein [Kaistia geumhonensis]
MADWQGGGHGNELAAWLAAKIIPALAGAAGAFVAHLLPPAKPWRERLVEYIGGALTAMHVGPVAGPVLYNAILAGCEFWHIDPPQALPAPSVESLASFLAGALGLGILRGLIVWIRRWAREPKMPG